MLQTQLRAEPRVVSRTRKTEKLPELVMKAESSEITISEKMFILPGTE